MAGDTSSPCIHAGVSVSRFFDEKTRVAAASVSAAFAVTGLKLVVGLFTGSLGILAEAAHSALDLVAALMTLFAVKVSARPADESHHYGHGKVENLSAFLEAGLLVVTAVWVIYEAIRRILFHEGNVEVSIWAFLVMGVSIAVDYVRSHALLRVARKFGSQALEADALHFSTDIWSSSVVIIGLAVVGLTKRYGWPGWFTQADALAALGVSIIVISVSVQLLRETVDALMDRAPAEIVPQMTALIKQVPNVVDIKRLRIRRAGNKYFADIVVTAPRTTPFDETRTVSDQVESAAMDSIHRFSPQADCDVIVHIDPIIAPTETMNDSIYLLAEHHGIRAHDIHIRQVHGKIEIDFDIEIPANMLLQDAHAIATHIEEDILSQYPLVSRVTTHLESPEPDIAKCDEVTETYPDLTRDICSMADEICGQGSTHDIHLYQEIRNAPMDTIMPQLDLVLHTVFAPSLRISDVHVHAEEIKRALRAKYPFLATVTIHTEPLESVN